MSGETIGRDDAFMRPPAVDQNLARKGQWFVEWGLVVDTCERLAQVRASLVEHEDAHLDKPAWVLAGTVQGLRFALSLLDPSETRVR